MPNEAPFSVELLTFIIFSVEGLESMKFFMSVCCCRFRSEKKADLFVILAGVLTSDIGPKILYLSLPLDSKTVYISKVKMKILISIN